MYGQLVWGGFPLGYALDVVGPPPPPYVPPITGLTKKALFLSSREINRATVFASSELTSLPVSNLQDMQPTKKWRSTSKANQYLVIELAGAVACNTIAFVGANFTSQAQVRIRGAHVESNLPNTPDVDSGWLSVWPSSGMPIVDEDFPPPTNLIFWPNEEPCQFWYVDLSDPGQTPYIEIGRLIINRAFQPAINVGSTYSIGLNTPDSQVRTSFGKTYTDWRGAASRVLVLPFNAIKVTDLKTAFITLQMYCGLSRDFIFCLNPLETGDTFYMFTMQALFSTPAQFETAAMFDTEGQRWHATLTLAEPL